MSTQARACGPAAAGIGEPDVTRPLLLLALAALVGLGGAMTWQHLRYLEARRERVLDLQPLLHASDAFHVVVFLQTEPGADLLAALRPLRRSLESGGQARVVYAGRVVSSPLASAQLVEAFGEEVAWSAVVALQLPSRAAWERLVGSEATRAVLKGFRRTYAHGMQRSPWLNLALPQALLALRIGQILSWAPSHFPFVPDPDAPLSPETQLQLDRLREERELGASAILVVNLLKEGTPEQEAADRAYRRRMLGLMAEGGHGPMHLGGAVTLERGTDFDQVALVYYPGVDYFVDMARSRFFQGIVGDKQLGDTQASITVPILDRI